MNPTRGRQPEGAARLRRGDLPPRVRVPPPGPRSRRIGRRLAAHEAPGINTLVGGRVPLIWEEALGSCVLDADGNRYLDLTSGFGAAAIGHRHPRVVAAVRRQAGRLLHGLGDAQPHAGRAELAARLGARAPLPDPQVYFAISGADAVEIALKTALLATGRPGVVAFDPAYHGTTAGALAVSSRPRFRRPFDAQLNPHVHRLPFGCPPPAVERLLRRAEIGCLLIEPIVGREGVLLPPAGWLAELAGRCRRHRTLLVADEVLTGLGRTGRWFAVEEEGVEPDLVCCGKALGGGLPIAAVLGRRSLLAAWPADGEALHTATFVAHPLACAAALETLAVLAAERLPQRAVRLGRAVAERLAGWPGRHPVVTATRGRGLLWGVELATRSDAAALAHAAAARGVLLLAGGREGRVAQILPPLTIPRRRLDQALDLLEDALCEVGAGAGRGGL